MKNTGVTRKMDALGRLVIPKEIRRVLGMNTGVPVEFLVDGNKVVLMTHRDMCCLCGAVANKEVASRKICVECIENIKNMEVV